MAAPLLSVFVHSEYDVDRRTQPAPALELARTATHRRRGRVGLGWRCRSQKRNLWRRGAGYNCADPRCHTSMDGTFPTGLPRPRPRPRPRPLPRPRPPRPPACPSSLTPLSMHNRTACVSAAAPQPWANYTQRCMEERTQTSWQRSSALRACACAMGAWAQTARAARGRATLVTQNTTNGAIRAVSTQQLHV